MTQPFFTSFILMLLMAGHAMAASVGPAGYTNAFATPPPAADWATLSIAGGANDAYDLDTDVNTNLNVAAATISFQTVSNVNNPASQLTNATWSSSGLFIQTRPNVNRYTVLMGKFVNNTGTNAAQINISYQLTMAGALAVEDAGKGTHVFYSLTGLAGSWTPLATLNNLTNTGSFALSTNVTLSWPVGGNLFLLWADDNTAVGTDTANEIDNFSLTVTAGGQPSLTLSLVAPTNGTVYLSGPAIGAAASVIYGTAPHTVEYFISSGAGNTSFTSAGSSTTPPFNVSLGALVAGTYNIYSVATDSGAPAETATSVTNTFFVVDPLLLTLTAPADGATVDTSVSVTGTATVSGGTAPYSVQFFLDGAASGSPVTSSPYERNFGPLAIADHTIRAEVTDGRGWISNSVIATVHVTGPLGVALTPTNGTTLNLGSALVLTAAVLGGNSPYMVTFYSNGQPVGSAGSAPYTLNLGPLPIGSYTCYVEAADSSLPTPQLASSSTNVITISPGPLLATLTAPANGQLVTAGQVLSLTANASVGAPLTVSNVEFYVDGVLVGTDASSPYSATTTPGLGSHAAYAAATDSLGRKTFTTTNAFAATTPPTAALVGPNGYTNDFTAQPLAVEWATLSIAGSAADAYTMDTEVNANISAANTTARTVATGGTPPAAAPTAVWASSGFYLQTRPTMNRYNALMGRFLNQSGTNATQINVSYLFTLTAAGVTEETGTRAYYSLSGLLGSWVNIPAFNVLSSALFSGVLTTNFNLTLTNGASFYLLWVDDNASGNGTDAADQYDNFSLTITAGLPLSFTTTLAAPTNTALFVSGTTISATATIASGTSPYTVEFFTNSGLGNTIFTSAGSSTTAPFNVNLGALPPGDYNIYSVATDSTLLITTSVTNVFRVADPIAFTLTAPADNSAFDNTTPVTGSATVAGGTLPYAVQFFFDDSPSGAAITSPPYERNFGALVAGDHTIRAVVTDGRGWVSNSLVSTVHISGSLGASLVPVDGAQFIFGSSISLTGTLGGGSAPYLADFYVNDQLVASFAAPPFRTNLGMVPVGSYTGYVHATDSSLPAPQQANSTTNIFTVLPNPITVVQTNPTNGQSGVAGQVFTWAATASVGSPLSMARVQFFFDGALVFTDNNAPYSILVGSPEGTHAFHVVATDVLGRMATSAVSTATFTVDPLANDNFASRSALGTPAHVTGNNTGATTQTGEATFFVVNGATFVQIGATLWWRWTAPFSGTVTIDTIGSSFNTFLAVYTGSALNQLSAVIQNDNTPGLAAVSL
ncbi:MAG TPA: Ig-like domain-containing protein, partial [Verrucomicrobiae bacterium]